MPFNYKAFRSISPEQSPCGNKPDATKPNNLAIDVGRLRASLICLPCAGAFHFSPVSPFHSNPKIFASCIHRIHPERSCAWRGRCFRSLQASDSFPEPFHIFAGCFRYPDLPHFCEKCFRFACLPANLSEEGSSFRQAGLALQRSSGQTVASIGESQAPMLASIFNTVESEISQLWKIRNS